MPARIIWQPQTGPQKALIDCGLSEVFFGGARGGGKTDGVLGKYALRASRYGAAFNALFCRRELPMLDDAIERSKQIYGPLGARWLDQHKTWRFAGGGRLRFRPLERLVDADKYQGQNISDVCIEEAGQYPDSRPIDRLHAVLRSANGIPTQLILTGNPGGAGQSWIKKRYIDPAPKGWKVLDRLIELPSWAGGGTINRKTVFIPSRVNDNRFLGRDYIAGLHLVGSSELVKAWLEGDWNAVEGAFFDCWDSRRHIVTPFEIPEHWLRFVAMDWGSAAPFSIGWWAVASESSPSIPRGAIVRYREWYGTGDKLTAEEVANGIILREKNAGESRRIEALEKNMDGGGGRVISYSVLDPSAFAQQGGPSIAERMARTGVFFKMADNRRVGKAGAMGGWDQMRARLKGDEDDGPMLIVFSTCTDFIRTVPGLQHDPDRPEDLDTKGEDHAADEARYACMSRPWIAKPPREDKPKLPKFLNQYTYDEFWKATKPQKERV